MEEGAKISASGSGATAKRQGYAGAGGAKARPLRDVDPARSLARTSSGFSEFDRVLGGGFVEGEVVLLGGDPGVGKSTLLIQSLARMDPSVSKLYVSGEESAEQIANRALRLGLDVGDVGAFCEVELESILDELTRCAPKFAVFDSIQTLYSSQFQSAPGSVTQVRECAAQIARFSKTTGCVSVIVGHVTKDGSLAGPRVLEHIVDAVLYFEGETHSSHRVARAFKNRFGAAQEIGIFEMGEEGLREVLNPSELFIVDHKKPVEGACVFSGSEGSRPLLLELQALVEPSPNPNPRRLAVGFDPQRLAMLLAVLQKSCGVSCSDQNVYLNATGGARVSEAAGDLPAMLAVLSSIRSFPLPTGLAAFGEIGLTGELRPSPKCSERLNEAAKLGFRRAIYPARSAPKKIPSGLDARGVDSLGEALSIIREWEQDDVAAGILSRAKGTP